MLMEPLPSLGLALSPTVNQNDEFEVVQIIVEWLKYDLSHLDE